MTRWIFCAILLWSSIDGLACVELLDHKVDTVPWLPQPHEVRIVASPHAPDPALVTGVYVLIFDGDKLLLGHRRDERVWDIVGGHVDATDTSLEAAVRREAKEEIGVNLRDLRPIAYEEIELKGPKPPGYKYPFPKSYQVFFVAHVESLEPMPLDEDTDQRDWFTPAALAYVPWAQRNRRLLDYARGQSSVEFN